MYDTHRDIPEEVFKRACLLYAARRYHEYLAREEARGKELSLPVPSDRERERTSDEALPEWSQKSQTLLVEKEDLVPQLIIIN